MRSRVLATLCVALLFVVPFGRTTLAQTPAEAGDHWVATWASAQQSRGGGPAPARAGGPAALPATGTPAPGSAPATPTVPAPPAPNPQTVRMILRASLGGRHVRVHLANTFGTTPLTVASAHVALHGQDSSIVAGSDRTLLFNGRSAVTIPQGAEMLSDVVDLDVPALGELAVSLFVPESSGVLSGHSMALQTTYVVAGSDVTAQPWLPEAATTSQAWSWVSAVDVMAPANAGTIVAFGDSITDGATSTPRTYHSWPSLLAARLAATPATAHLAIVNEGISGNKVLADGAGVNALARFDRDVLSVAGVRWFMILEGINDIGGIQRGLPLDGDALVAGLAQLAERAHSHGIKVVGCTLTPYGGAGYYSDTGEEIRMKVNTFIRTSPLFDAVVDFDALTRDAAAPKQLVPAYNTSDHLHPNDTGYQAMANGVDLGIFGR